MAGNGSMSSIDGASPPIYASNEHSTVPPAKRLKHADQCCQRGYLFVSTPPRRIILNVPTSNQTDHGGSSARLEVSVPPPELMQQSVPVASGCEPVSDEDCVTAFLQLMHGGQ